MNENELKKLLDNSEQSPNPQAKQEAIRTAVNAFEAMHAQQKIAEPIDDKKTEKKSQGLFSWLRLTSSSNKMNRRTPMNKPRFPQQRWFLGGVATASLAFFGLMLATYHPAFKTPTPMDMDTYELNLPEPAKKPSLPEREIQTEFDSAAAPPAESAMLDALSKDKRGQLPDAELMSTPGLARAKITTEKRAQQTGFMAERKLMADDAYTHPSFQAEGKDRFENFETNPIKLTSEEPVSTFSIDVDTASYSFVRRQLKQGVLPQKDAVRLEEMVNYFDYHYPLPDARNEPFSRNITVIDAPWNDKKKLIHIGIKGYELKEQPKSNLVFLLDVSGSMASPDKLPLVKQSMNLLLSKLRPDDTVAIAVYAGAAGTVLEPTPVSDKQKIISAINALQPGGGTAGAQGIKLAYQLAETSFKKDAVNRIILATDGDFNVGISNTEELKGFIERKREKGIYLSVLGFGSGNYHDKLMQDLAQNGNGVAAYIDTLSEAQKVLVNEATSNLFPIAKDVKIQVEFNPASVSEYRLLGYETRTLKREDFNNDAVDAGEIGAGHTVTAIYEITPKGSGAELVDGSRYTKTEAGSEKGDEYAFLKIRYKLPKENKSKLLSSPISKHTKADATALREANFATAVAGFAQLLKDAKYTGEWTYQDAIALAQEHKGNDEYGYRTELVQLIRMASIAQEM
ncbi:Ca-activated chloride channel family protein [Alteromonadaceae bacterium Bs31]|nr:Ca-activated chloride channel family protein [Alteromonadaceae bacterium Bs31]